MMRPPPISALVPDTTLIRSNETFTVDLSNPVNGTIADGQGVGTILNDDNVPTIDIQLVALTLEGNFGQAPVTLNVNLSNESDQPVSVSFQTSDGTATASNND